MKSTLSIAISVAAAVVTLPAAASVTFTGSGTAPTGGVTATASAQFTISANQLTIVLTNTSPSNNGQDVPGSTLTGLFWDFSGSNPLLTPGSATASDIIQSNFCSPASACNGTNVNVGGEFGYQRDGSGFPAHNGISSSGYLTTGLSGNIGNFNNGAAGTNLNDPVSLDGINFGIVSAAAGFNPNGGLESVPLVRDTMTFVLTGVSGLSESSITNVSFQYGTSLSETRIVGSTGGSTSSTSSGISSGGAPEPASGPLALLSLAMLGGATWLRRRKSAV
jgi:MYXO-CTERM domain-containing protein